VAAITFSIEQIFRLIKNTGFAICHFKDKKHSEEAPPHYYVSVPVSEKIALLLCIVTSKSEKIKNFYRKTNNHAAIVSLVPAPPGTFDFLRSPETVIECNKAELFTVDDLKKRADSRGFQFKANDGQIPDDLKGRIIQAIRLSPIVSPYIKSILLK
jgi:hypothetical protein